MVHLRQDLLHSLVPTLRYLEGHFLLRGLVCCDYIVALESKHFGLAIMLTSLGEGSLGLQLLGL